MTKYTVEAGSGWRATLDGKQVLYCQEADDEAGYVLAPLIDAEGKPIFDHSREEYAIVRREGKVELQGGMTPALQAFIAKDHSAFRVEQAREGELGVGYDNKMQPVFTNQEYAVMMGVAEPEKHYEAFPPARSENNTE